MASDLGGNVQLDGHGRREEDLHVGCQVGVNDADLGREQPEADADAALVAQRAGHGARAHALQVRLGDVRVQRRADEHHEEEPRAQAREGL